MSDNNFHKLIERPPKFIVVWGSGLIFFILLVLFTVICFVKIEDNVTGKVYKINNDKGALNLFISLTNNNSKYLKGEIVYLRNITNKDIRFNFKIIKINIIDSKNVIIVVPSEYKESTNKYLKSVGNEVILNIKGIPFYKIFQTI